MSAIFGWSGLWGHAVADDVLDAAVAASRKGPVAWAVVIRTLTRWYSYSTPHGSKDIKASLRSVLDGCASETPHHTVPTALIGYCMSGIVFDAGAVQPVVFMEPERTAFAQLGEMTYGSGNDAAVLLGTTVNERRSRGIAPQAALHSAIADLAVDPSQAALMLTDAHLFIARSHHPLYIGGDGDDVVIGSVPWNSSREPQMIEPPESES